MVSSLLPRINHHRPANQFRVSVLDKYPSPGNSSNGALTFLPWHSSGEDHHIVCEYRSTDLLRQQIIDLEKGDTPAAIQMMAETSVESRAQAMRMTRHVVQMSKHLQSRLLDMMECRLLQQQQPLVVARKRKKTHER
ncbi:hypothetical protein U1Q18_007116 [Sarracenia purpurea var. burkii]